MTEREAIIALLMKLDVLRCPLDRPIVKDVPCYSYPRILIDEILEMRGQIEQASNASAR